jgi:hypothetical protein
MKGMVLLVSISSIDQFAPRSAHMNGGKAAWILRKGHGGYTDAQNPAGVP